MSAAHVSANGSTSSLSHTHSAARRISARLGSRGGSALRRQNASAAASPPAARSASARERASRAIRDWDSSCIATGLVQSRACEAAVPRPGPTIGTVAPDQVDEEEDEGGEAVVVGAREVAAAGASPRRSSSPSPSRSSSRSSSSRRFLRTFSQSTSSTTAGRSVRRTWAPAAAAARPHRPTPAPSSRTLRPRRRALSASHSPRCRTSTAAPSQTRHTPVVAATE